MKVLGFDTSTQTSGVALVDDGMLLAEARHDASGRSADLLVAIDDVCRRANVAPTELDAVAVGAGPGSFTGLRIGMATAKGIAFAAQRPLWAVSSLQALAYDAREAAIVVALIDARRSEVFAGCYRDLTLVGEERVLPPSDVAAWVHGLVGETCRYAGNAREVLASDRWLDNITTPSGYAICQLALAGPRRDILTNGAPTYIRPSEAEVLYPDGVPGALRR